MRHRQEEIRAKGFALTEPEPTGAPLDFSKLRVGVKTLEDAIVDTNPYKSLGSSKKYANKNFILKALTNKDFESLRRISNLFFDSSGIYSHACKYLASLYRYDWYLIPYINDSDKVNEDKVLKEFANLLEFFDNSHLKLQCNDLALKVIKNGCYYGYILKANTHLSIQELPIEYCRTRYMRNSIPVVEFNMRYFDDKFTDVQYRLRVLKAFPEEFSKAYVMYKNGKLKPDYSGDTSGWYMLDPDLAFKLNLGGSDMPILANAIPAIINLAEAQDLDRKKMMQRLLKIIIQKLPTDKNGDLIFDVEEARDLHNNAVTMLKNSIGVDVLTTFADTDAINLSDSNTATTSDDLAKVERAVYNEFGFAKNLFNSDGNIALEKSTLVDEATIRTLVLTFQAFFDRILKLISSKNKKYHFNFRMLETTQFNYKELSKLYKDQVQIGYSKMLPQIALGHSQSEILAMATFENQVLHLSDIMIPPMSSNTMSGKVESQEINATTKKNTSQTTTKKTTKVVDSEESKGGRPELPDDQKSEKTIQNREGMS